MPKFKNRINEVYGRLTVVEHSGKDCRGKHMWLCRCSCGKEKVVSSDNLSSWKSKSCGCLKSEFLSRKGNQWGLFTDREVALLKVQYHHIKKRNKKKGFTDIISFDEFRVLSKSPCTYCNISHSREIEDRLSENPNQKRLSDHILKINGIDRVNSSLGYTSDNSVACCGTCNFAKHTMNESEFFRWIRSVYEHMTEKNPHTSEQEVEIT